MKAETIPAALEPLIALIAERVHAIDDAPLAYTYAEAGRRLGLSKNAVRDLVLDGELKKVNVGRGAQREAPRIERAELERFLQRRKLEGR